MNAATTMDPRDPPTHGVVAVISRQQRFLVIRRSAYVRAPGRLCFPGGGVEPGETQPEALRRELREELGVDIEPYEPLWHCVTDWGVPLTWWSAALSANSVLRPAPAEVASWSWLTAAEIRAAPLVLNSNLAFLDYWESRMGSDGGAGIDSHSS